MQNARTFFDGPRRSGLEPVGFLRVNQSWKDAVDAIDLSYVALAILPVGGILIAVPLALLHLNYPIWLVLLTAPALAYIQVLVVDLGWSALERWPRWRSMLERRRSRRVERLVESKGAFWATFVAAGLISPWVVMAFMRYARLPQRRVALPIYLSMLTVTIIVAAICVFVPGWFSSTL